MTYRGFNTLPIMTLVVFVVCALLGIAGVLAEEPKMVGVAVWLAVLGFGLALLTLAEDLRVEE